MTSLPGCACSCCGATGPLITPADVPTGQSFATFLNASRTFTPANTITPAAFQGSGFSSVGVASAVGGTLSFSGFQADTLSLLSNVRNFSGDQVAVTLPNGTTATTRQLAATAGTAPWFPFPSYNVFNTGSRQLELAGTLVETTAIYQLDFQLQPEILITDFDGDSRLVTVRHAAVPELDKFHFLRNVAPPLQDPEAIWRSSRQCRIVIERDGQVVLDAVRPSDASVVDATAQDGSYIQTSYFADEYDAFAPSVLLPPRPTRLIQTFRKDTTTPVLGFLPWSDSDQIVEPADRPMVGFCTKPSRQGFVPAGVFLEDESDPGAATRPAPATLVGAAGQMPLSVTSQVGTHPVTGGVIRELVATSSDAIRDFANLLPTVFPRLRYTQHPALPGAKRMAAARIIHPGLDTREHFRARTQLERVATVSVVFQQPVKVAANGRQAQILFTVNGSAVSGSSFAWDQETLTARISVPTAAQEPGAFCVLEFDPNGAFVSDDQDQTETYMAVRTSWLMQRPYARLPDNTRRDVVIGSWASIAEVADAPREDLPLVVALGPSTGVERNLPDLGRVGIASVRKGSDRFTPRLPAVDDPPADCSYYGLTATIDPCPPKKLDCPMPREAEPHNSAFLFGGGADSITVRLLEGPSGAGVNALIAYGPLTFRPTKAGRRMAPNTWALDAGVNFGYLSAQRRVTQYDRLSAAYPWELILDLRAVFTSPSSIASPNRVFVISLAQESQGTFTYIEPRTIFGPLWRWQITL